jgi:hypothetical protein
MDNEKKTLQLFYAAALADAAYHYGKKGIFDEVTAEKKELQERAASTQLMQLGVKTVPALYTVFSDLFGCAGWSVEETSDGWEAVTPSCLLCALAKKQGAPQPCGPFCINPFTAFAEALGHRLEVTETLWDGNRCRFYHKIL